MLMTVARMEICHVKFSESENRLPDFPSILCVFIDSILDFLYRLN